MTWWPAVITDAALPLRGEWQGRGVLGGRIVPLPVQDRALVAAVLLALAERRKAAR